MSRKAKIACFDNGGKTVDRYTVVFLNQPERETNVFCALGMSDRPDQPNGFCQHTSAKLGRHLGKRITLAAMPFPCQSIVRRELQSETVSNG